MRFLIDMSLSPKWVELLTEAGHQATHWTNIGPGNAPDSELLSYAQTNELVILTNDLDFGTVAGISLNINSGSLSLSRWALPV